MGSLNLDNGYPVGNPGEKVGPVVWEDPPEAWHATRPPSKAIRGRRWGSATERATVKQLVPMFPEAKRIGSLGYTAGHPDIVQDAEEDQPILNMVVVRDKRQPLLATVSLDDLEMLIQLTPEQISKLALRCQVKGRATTWIGKVYAQLTRSVMEDNVVRSAKRTKAKSWRELQKMGYTEPE
jgi:hypothetical protein